LARRVWYMYLARTVVLGPWYLAVVLGPPCTVWYLASATPWYLVLGPRPGPPAER
jgi:hypothetical protein